MLNEEALKIKLNNKTFSKTESASIVGGKGRLLDLVGKNLIRMEKKPANKQNGRWHCNAWDVIKYAKI